MAAVGGGPEEWETLNRDGHTAQIGRTSFLRSLIGKLRDPVIILPYLSYGTATRFTVRGRVLQDERWAPARDADTRRRNLVTFLKRMESDEVAGARVGVRFQEVEKEAVSDREGYFSVELQPRALAPGLWQEVAVMLVENPSIEGTAKVLVPPTDAEFGVISDIDDTIVYSNVTRKLRMVLALAFSNARTRKPFEGVAAFYQALHRGRNPLFYVSKSPWNLYAPLVEFLELQGLPPGPLLLRDFGWRMQKEHKEREIRRIIETYPRLGFILIGDSGEQDPEIYSEVVRSFPERIRVIYIRSVVKDQARLDAIQRLIDEVAKAGCQLVLAPDSEFAAAHAAAEGLISPAALPLVRAGKLADARAPRTGPPPAAR
jgi:phosphatidate phosphatase APP1